MNVLHVSNTDLMGRRFNGFDLLEEHRSLGVIGKQAVLNKCSDSPDVIPLLATAGDDALHHACVIEERRRSMNNLLFPWGTVLTETPEFEDADVVHLHLIHNQVVSLFDVPHVVGRKPTVWTFHDPWPMTGHCIYPQSCEKWVSGCTACPALDAVFAMADDRASTMWSIKQDVLGGLDVDIVVASEFMLDMVRRSPLTSHFENVHVIPFGIDVESFLADDQKAASRRALRIPEEDFVVLFRATTSEVKGLRHIIEALESSPPGRPTTLLTLDHHGLVDRLADRYGIVQLGWVDDDSVLARAYSAADVFVMPSTAEAFGLMALEAMAAGRPVVCFEGTSIPSVTHAPECGIAVPMADSLALRAALDALASDPEEAERRGRLGRELAVERYGHGRYLESLARLYRRVAERPRNLGRRDGHTDPGPLAGVSICLVFEYDLSHHTRFLREIAALREAGAAVQLLTSHPEVADAPAGMKVTIAPLQFESLGTTGSSPGRDNALRMLRPQVDLFWVSDFLSLPGVLQATKDTSVRVVYETVDLVPEYPHQGEEYRERLLEGERALIGDVDGFITACDSYADYYMEQYGDILSRRPLVSDNAPDRRVGRFRATARPLRLLFFGQLMFDRPVLELIDAMALTEADVTLTFQGTNHIGDAPLARIGSLGLQDRVILLEPCPPEAIVDTAAAYDVGVVALRGADENERRASTSKLFTYMNSGLAVLGSDLPGIARVVERHGNGLLVKGMEPAAWAEAIDRFAALPLPEVDAMKQASLDSAEEYSWERQREGFVAEFQRAIGSKQRA